METPRFGRKSNFLFVPGTKVTFECNQDFTLIGDTRRTCMPDGRWDTPEYGYTECLREYKNINTKQKYIQIKIATRFFLKYIIRTWKTLLSVDSTFRFL